MHSDVSGRPLTTDCYVSKTSYISHTVTTKQKLIADTQKTREEKSNHIKKVTHTREGSQRRTYDGNNQRTPDRMAVSARCR